MIKDFGCNYEERWLLRRRIAVENLMWVVLWAASSHETLLYCFCMSVWVALGPHTVDVYRCLLQCIELQSGRTFHSCPCSVLVFGKTRPWNAQSKPWRSRYWCQLLQLFWIDKKLNWKKNSVYRAFYWRFLILRMKFLGREGFRRNKVLIVRTLMRTSTQKLKWEIVQRCHLGTWCMWGRSW